MAGKLKGLLEGTLIVSTVSVADKRPALPIFLSSGAWEESEAVQITTVPSAEPVANLMLDVL